MGQRSPVADYFTDSRTGNNYHAPQSISNAIDVEGNINISEITENMQYISEDDVHSSVYELSTLHKMNISYSEEDELQNDTYYNNFFITETEEDVRSMVHSADDTPLFPTTIIQVPSISQRVQLQLKVLTANGQHDVTEESTTDATRTQDPACRSKILLDRCLQTIVKVNSSQGLPHTRLQLRNLCRCHFSPTG